MYKLVISIILLLCSIISVGEVVITENVKDLNAFYEKITNDKPEKDSTLIIFDIDDTLMEPMNFVGSGKWYNWQRGRVVYDVNGKQITIDDKDKFNCIFSTLGTLFDLGTMKLTQDNSAQIVNQLKAYDLMILTARTYGFRSATERELASNGINVKDEHLMAEDTGLEFILDPKSPGAKITYKNGIVMSSGQNKGLVLKEILKRVHKSYKNIYFIDDSRKNIDNMAKQWATNDSTVKIFHYTKVDKTISLEELEQSKAAKKLFDLFLKNTYPTRYQAFQNGQCR